MRQIWSSAMQEAAQEIEQLKDKYLRSVAELDNYRKRVAREREQQYLRSRMELIRQVLPVADDFGLAPESCPGGLCGSAVDRGYHADPTQVGDVPERRLGVVPIEATGQPFDPHLS